jgi:hypothetical protein
MGTKKILIFNTAQVVDLIGGSQASLEDAILNFLDNNIEVIYISYKYNPIINYNGPNFKRFFIHRFRNKPFKSILDILLILSFTLFRKFDYVWANSALPCFIFMPFIISKNKIYTFHGPIIEEQNYSNKSLIKISLTKYLYQLFLNCFDKLHYNTKYVKNAVEKEYVFVKNYQQIISEILVDDISFKNKFININNLNLYPNKLKVLIPRRLVKRTGVINFINLINNLPDSILNKFIFLISGDGPEKNTILDSIKNNDNIIYLGLLTEEQLNVILFNIDVVCIPSIAAEGFCLPARQGMILNKFILHTGQGGLLETTDKYYKSLIFNYTNLESLNLQLNNILEFKNKHSENYVFDSYEFKLKKLFKNLYV